MPAYCCLLTNIFRLVGVKVELMFQCSLNFKKASLVLGIESLVFFKLILRDQSFKQKISLVLAVERCLLLFLTFACKFMDLLEITWSRTLSLP